MESLLRQILSEIKEAIDAGEKYQTDWLPWGDNHVSLTGLKRLIYGIWHEGHNERGDNMVKFMVEPEEERYLQIIEKYKNYQEIKVNLPPYD